MVRTKSVPRRINRGRRERIRLTLREAKSFVKERQTRIDLFNQIVFYKQMGLLNQQEVPTVAEITYAENPWNYLNKCRVLLNDLATCNVQIEMIKVEPVAKEQTWICPICQLPENGTAMIGCDVCDGYSSWYHFHCVGIEKVPRKAQPWICPKCNI